MEDHGIGPEAPVAKKARVDFSETEQNLPHAVVFKDSTFKRKDPKMSSKFNGGASACYVCDLVRTLGCPTKLAGTCNADTEDINFIMRCDHNELCKQGHLSSNGPVLDVFSMGCLFHFKQAIRRRLLKLGVSKSKVKDFMVRGGPVDWLTVMPLDEIEEQGIAFVKANFDCGELSSKFEAFWGYFREVALTLTPGI